jgi:hypothetical protein
MADNDIVEEITVEHGKRTLVASAFERIRLLFHVLVNFSSPEESAVKSGIQWLALKGEKEAVTKAKVCRNISLKVSLCFRFCCFMALKVRISICHPFEIQRACHKALKTSVLLIEAILAF